MITTTTQTQLEAVLAAPAPETLDTVRNRMDELSKAFALQNACTAYQFKLAGDIAVLGIADPRGALLYETFKWFNVLRTLQPGTLVWLSECKPIRMHGEWVRVLRIKLSTEFDSGIGIYYAEDEYNPCDASWFRAASEATQ